MTKTDLISQDLNLPTKVLSFITNTLKSDQFELLPLAGDASNRRYFRAVHGGKSWVLMVWEPFASPADYPFLNVQLHFKKHGVNVPDVVALSPEDGLILLEDLGDLTLERKFWESQNQNVVVPFYHQALNELLKIHFAASSDRDESCSAFHMAFDKEKLLWEMNYGRDHLFVKMLKLSLSPQVDKQLTTIFESICERLANEPRYISHRDYHSRNLMLKLGQMRVIDFQDARMGPVQYDLVSLLYDSYVQLSPETRTELLDYYVEKAEEITQKSIDRSHFEEVMSWQIIQRCFKACGSFSSFYNMREDRRYLKYLQHTLRTVVKTAADFPEYKPFADLMIDNGLLERKYDEL